MERFLTYSGLVILWIGVAIINPSTYHQIFGVFIIMFGCLISMLAEDISRLK